MNKSVEIIRKTRTSLLGLIGDLSLEQLNTVPPGFNNNIIWNIGHLIAAQQGVCYRRAGVAMRIEDGFFEGYMPGSKPEGAVTQEGVDQIKELLFSTLDQLEIDYKDQLFTNYPAWATRYGVNIASFDDGVNFLQFHEGIHMGYIMALKRVMITE